MSSEDEEDDAPPMATSLRASRADALSLEQIAPTTRSVREGQKASQKRQAGLVTANLRGDDYLPTEVLSQLSHAPTQPVAASTSDDSARAPRAAAKKGQGSSREAERVKEPPTGLPRVVRKLGATVQVAVLEGPGNGMSQPREHAPVRADVRDFVQKQLYGGNRRRSPAATIKSLKASSGRFGPASNFATVALPPTAAEKSSKKRKRGGATAPAKAPYSSLEMMAARLMNKKK